MIITKDSVDVTTYFKLIDPASGVPETGLTITDLDATYVRDGATAVKADLTALAAADSVHGANKGFEVDGTNCPGLYRIDWPDAAFATAVENVQLCVNGAAIDPAYIEVRLTDLDFDTIMRGTDSALTAAVVNVANGAIEADLTYIHGTALTETAGQLAGSFIKLYDVAAPTATCLSLPDAVPGAAGGGFIAGTNAATVVTTSLTTTFTGDLTGKVDGTVNGKTPSEAGDAMTLAADAIKAVTYDQSTAFPMADADGTALTEAGGDGDHLVEAGGDGDHLVEAGGDGDQLTAINLPNQTMDIAGTITSVTGNVDGNVGGTVNGLTAVALKDMFDTDSTTNYAGAVAGSVVKEIADNAGGSALTEAGIADAVWDELVTGHDGAGKAGQQLWTDIDAILADTNELQGDDVPGLIATAQTDLDTITGANGVNITDDAITASKYDQSTAFPLADSNGTALTEAGGDGDHLVEAGGDGDQLTAIDLPNQTMDIIGDITGNISGSVGTVTALGAQAKLDVNVECDQANTDYDALKMTDAIEGTYDVQEALRLILSVLVGKVDGGGTTTVTFRDTGDGTNRVVATVDANGNRTAVTLDPA